MNSTKRILILLCVFLFLCSGCGEQTDAGDKTISCDGLTMTVSSQYYDWSAQGYYSDYDLAYGYGEITLLGYRVPRSDLEAGWNPTLLEFAQNFAYTYNINRPVKNQGGFVTLYDEMQENDILWSVLTGFYACDDGFWILEFSCPADVFDTMENTFLQYLSSVQIESITKQ